MPRRNSTAFFVAGFMLGMASAPDASAQRAVVEGVARSEDNSVPVAFALVRLMSGDSTVPAVGTPPQGMTNADGRYRFSNVVPGKYRVQLLRIGFQPTFSEPVEVASGTTVEVSIRAASHPIELPAMIVTGAACVGAGELARHPQLLVLWEQARNGASIHDELMDRFRYRSTSREESFEVTPNGPTPPGRFERPLISDPKSARANATRIRTQRISNGYYGPNDGWYLPSELDVLHEDFLRAHCFDEQAAHIDGEVGLRFRPTNVRRDFLDVRGTIWLDSATYLVRRIDFEYVDAEDSRGTVRLEFEDIAVLGATLRMPTNGTFVMRPSRKNPDRRTEGRFTFTYEDFREMRTR